MSNTNKVQTVGLLNALELIAPETAATVGQLSELCRIVNFNAHSAAKKVTSLEEQLAEQKEFNAELLKLLGEQNKNTAHLGEIIDSAIDDIAVIDKDIDGIYTDINHDTKTGTFTRLSVLDEIGAVETYKGSNVYVMQEDKGEKPSLSDLTFPPARHEEDFTDVCVYSFNCYTSK